MSLRLGNQILKQQRTSPLVIQHIKELMLPIQTRYSRGEYNIKVNTVADPYDREYRAFWRYQSFFPLEFVKAICDSLPSDVEFIRYDHLTNTLTLNKL